MGYTQIVSRRLVFYACPPHRGIRCLVKRPARQARSCENSGAYRSVGRWKSRKTRSVGASVVEMKIDFGPGYRVYYIQRGQLLILMLCGGDKSTQTNDIRRAKLIAAQWDELD